MLASKTLGDSPYRSLELARVLVVDDNVASRLTLQTLLRAGGYRVEVAASAAEAVEKLDTREYELVLTDMQLESPEAGLKVLAHAKFKDYKPATSLITAYQESNGFATGPENDVVVETNDVSGLLDKVAELIGLRAMKRVARALRQAS